MERPLAFVVDPLEAPEAPGVLIRRTVGSERLAVLDPLMLADHLTLDASASGGAVGFPRHPHRGIETLTLVFAGEVRHEDSLGNASTVGAGGAQWMKAGRGIFHQEMFSPDTAGACEALQLWFALPRARKGDPPGYRAAHAGDLPRGEGWSLVCGSFGGSVGPLAGIAVEPIVLIFRLEPGQGLEVPVPADATAVAILASGTLQIGSASFGGGRLGVLGSGEVAALRAAGDRVATGALVAARPTGDPIVQYRSFVMNTVDEIARCVSDLERGTFA